MGVVHAELVPGPFPAGLGSVEAPLRGRVFDGVTDDDGELPQAGILFQVRSTKEARDLVRRREKVHVGRSDSRRDRISREETEPSRVMTRLFLGPESDPESHFFWD